MKKILFSMLVLSLTIGAKAQEIPERKADKPQMMERKKHHQGMMEMQKLNLTEDQKAKIKSQQQIFHQQMEELKKNDNITVKEWKTKAEILHREHKANMDGILTSEQKVQLEKMKAEGRAKHDEMDKQRLEKMKTSLGLSDEQSAKMGANRKEMGEKIKAIRENKSLSDEQRKVQMKELMKKQKENMKSILTEEQLKKLKETHHKQSEGERRKPETKQTI